MEQRFSIIRPLFGINYRQFNQIAGTFIEKINTLWKHRSNVCITLYNAVPSFMTTVQDDLNQSMNDSNAEMVFKKCSKLEHVSKSDFKKAAYIDIHIVQASGHSIGFATISFKGLCPRHAICYVQPKHDGETMLYQMTKKSSFGLFFSHGDGREENHYMISLPCRLAHYA